MMIRELLQISILLRFFLINGLELPKGSPCQTPNNEAAHCINLAECSILRDALLTRDTNAVHFAQMSQCGYEEGPLVCCGSYDSLRVSGPFSDSPKVCGKQEPANKVINGEITAVGEHPWLALLGYTFKNNGSSAGFKCGGTLISEEFVMTAAHCILLLVNSPYEVQFVRLGEWQISTEEDCFKDGVAINRCADPVLDVPISKTIIHEDYSPSELRNDIALLKMAQKVNPTAYIRIICLPQPNATVPPKGTLLTVVGWGATESSASSDYKRKADLPLISQQRCESKYNTNIKITDKQFCAGGIMGKDSCEGDSGGPLVGTIENGGNQWYQEGIISVGQYCDTDQPGVYTRVASYVDWINNHTKVS